MCSFAPPENEKPLKDAQKNAAIFQQYCTHSTISQCVGMWPFRQKSPVAIERKAALPETLTGTELRQVQVMGHLPKICSNRDCSQASGGGAGDFKATN